MEEYKNELARVTKDRHSSSKIHMAGNVINMTGNMVGNVINIAGYMAGNMNRQQITTKVIK